METIKFASLIITVSKSFASIKRVDAILNMESPIDLNNHTDKESSYFI